MFKLSTFEPRICITHLDEVFGIPLDKFQCVQWVKHDMELDVVCALLLHYDFDLVVTEDHLRYGYSVQDFFKLFDFLCIQDGQSLCANVPLVVDTDRRVVFQGEGGDRGWDDHLAAMATDRVVVVTRGCRVLLLYGGVEYFL